MPRPVCRGTHGLRRLDSQGLKLVFMVRGVVTGKGIVPDAALAIAMGMAVRRDLCVHGGGCRMGGRAMGEDHDNGRDEQRKGGRQRDHTVRYV